MGLFFKKILFCSILQHPGYFFEETSLNKFRIPNCHSILSKELFHATFLKSYHLLQKKTGFAAFRSNLIIFRKPS